MESSYQNPQAHTEQKQLPGMLNVLTILTFIGCALGYMSALFNLATSADPERERQEVEESMGDAPDWLQQFMNGMMDFAKDSYEHRYVLLTVSLVCITLCLVGAIMMRRLKKTGYPVYVIGEVLPVIVSAILVGGTFFGKFIIGFNAFIAILFVVLYTSQRKHLVY